MREKLLGNMYLSEEKALSVCTTCRRQQHSQHRTDHGIEKENHSHAASFRRSENAKHYWKEDAQGQGSRSPVR